METLRGFGWARTGLQQVEKFPRSLGEHILPKRPKSYIPLLKYRKSLRSWTTWTWNHDCYSQPGVLYPEHRVFLQHKLTNHRGCRDIELGHNDVPPSPWGWKKAWIPFQFPHLWNYSVFAFVPILQRVRSYVDSCDLLFEVLPGMGKRFLYSTESRSLSW